MPRADEGKGSADAVTHHSWLVLAYRVPGEPSRLRAAVWRHVKRAGAVYLAHSVAVLPDSEAGERMLRRLCSEIREMGGSSQVLRATALAGELDMVRTVNTARNREYGKIIAASNELFIDIDSRIAAGHCALADLNEFSRGLEKLARWNTKVRAASEFDASLAAPAADTLAKCQSALNHLADCVYRAM